MSILKSSTFLSRLAVALVLAMSFALAGCDIDVEESAEPDEVAEESTAAQSPALADNDAYGTDDAYGGGSKQTADPRPEAEMVCANCGTVVSIEEVKAKGEGTGLGAVIGGVAGAVAGRQVGGGTGKDIATVAGAAGGAAAGHEIEKRVRGETYYLVTVAMDTGGQETVELASAEGVRVGDEVEIDGNNLILR